MNVNVSIIIPVYNGEKYIAEAIESVLNQTYSEFELIILNDDSTDNTEKVINKYLVDERVKYFKNTTRLGMIKNWNKGLDISKGKYIKILCHDDILEKDCVKRQYLALKQHEKVSIVTSKSKVILDNGKAILKRKCFKHENIYNGNVLIKKALKSKKNCFGETSVYMIKRTEERFDNHIYAPDFEFAIKILQNKELYFVDEFLSKYRIADNNTTIRLIRNINETSNVILKEDNEFNISLGNNKQSIVEKIKILSRFYLRAIVVMLLKNNGQAIKYVMVGGINTLISYAIYITLLINNVNFVVANTIGYISGMLNSYFMNKKTVFKFKGSIKKSAVFFIGINIFALLLSNILLYITIIQLHINKYLAQCIISFLLMLISYIFNRKVTFNK